MFENTKAFSGFAVDDVATARKFYGETLGLRTSEQNGLLILHIAGDRDTLVYPKPEDDLKAAVEYLRTNAPQLGIDAGRILVQGFDAGAALGAQALVGDAPGAFIGFSGRYDGSQRDPNRYYGGPANSPDSQVQERYATSNSIAQAGSAAGPALLYAGEQDDAAVQSATSFRDALQSAGKDVTLTLVPGASSGFDQEKSGALTPAGQQAAQQVLEWLRARFPPS